MGKGFHERSQVSIQEQINKKVSELNTLLVEIRALKSVHPGCRLSFSPYLAGSILNAYREGDLNFDEAVRAIENLTQKQAEHNAH